MTDPVVPSDEDELREALLRVITREVRRGCGRVNRMAEDLAEDVLNDPAIASVLADRERYADQRAAEELRAAAKEYGLAPTGKPWLPQAYMRARAAALAPENARAE